MRVSSSELNSKQQEIASLQETIAGLNMEKINWHKDLAFLHDKYRQVEGSYKKAQTVIKEQQRNLQRSKELNEKYERIIKKLEEDKSGLLSMSNSVAYSSNKEDPQLEGLLEQEPLDEAVFDEKFKQIRMKYQLNASKANKN